MAGDTEVKKVGIRTMSSVDNTIYSRKRKIDTSTLVSELLRESTFREMVRRLRLHNGSLGLDASGEQ